MNHPTPAQCRMIADTLALSSGTLDMMESNIFCGDCGTVACHAGHYLLGYYRRKKSPEEYNGENFLCNGQEMLTYTKGVNLMAYHMGFDCGYKMMEWAKDNPALWGNDRGMRMFDSREAFNNDIRVVNLEYIIAHWRAVADRIEAATQEYSAVTALAA